MTQCNTRSSTNRLPTKLLGSLSLLYVLVSSLVSSGWLQQQATTAATTSASTNHRIASVPKPNKQQSTNSPPLNDQKMHTVDEATKAPSFSPRRNDPQPTAQQIVDFLQEGLQQTNTKNTKEASSLVYKANKTHTLLKESSVDRSPEPGGADVLERVCILEEEAKHEETKISILSYSANGEPIPGFAHFHFCRDDDPPDCNWHTQTTGRRLEDWLTDSEGRLIRDETLLVTEFWHNPAHCLNDQAFSLAVDATTRGLLKRLQSGERKPLYPKYIHIGQQGFWFEWPKEDSWCRDFFRSTGLVDVPNGLVYKRPMQQRKAGRPTICFERLIIPRIEAYRHSKADGVPSIRKLQQLAWNDTQLRSDPWQQEERSKEASVLLYSREGNFRRVWANAEAVKEQIETKYHARVKLLGTDWDELNFTAQTSMYNSYPIIVAPHGAHLANLFFARPGTKVVEVMCSTKLDDRPPAPNVSIQSRGEARNDEEWYGKTPPSPYDLLDWFTSFSRHLSIEHFAYGEYDGCLLLNGTLDPRYSPPEFMVEVSTFVSFLGSRLGLKKRIGGEKQS